MKKKVAKLLEVKSLITLSMTFAMIVMIFLPYEIDRELLILFSGTYGSVITYYFKRNEKE
jgi:hypothetical protein